MKKFKVEIGYSVSFTVIAKNKEEAEEFAWFEFDQTEPHEPEIELKEIKNEDKKRNRMEI